MNKHKAIRFFIVSTVLFMQITFLTMIVKEQYKLDNFTYVILMLLLSLTLLFGYKYLDLHHEEYVYEKFIVALWVPVGAVTCYLLNLYFGFGSVISAGIIGTLASFLPSINKDAYYLKQLPAAIYCGVFVGMSSVEIIPSIVLVIAAGTLAGLFFMLSKNLFVEMGGKLGSIAFVGVVIITLINGL
ncbi:MAG: hypothetical protein ACI87N_002472 [Flavobacteriales bacterium]|jgi:hypothetical protein